MSSCENGEISGEAMLEKEHMQAWDVKEEGGFAICESSRRHEGGSPGVTEVNKRSAETGSDPHQVASSKRPRLCSETRQFLGDKGSRQEPLCLATVGEKRDHLQDRAWSSYRKPLFSISHRISEKRNPPSLEQQLDHSSFNSLTALSPRLQSPDQNGPPETFAAADASDQTSRTDSGLYPLLEKMFFLLNSLNSSVTQLHSKVDSLTLEVTRIKKQLKPAERATDFRPPPEYLLTDEELSQLTEHTSSAGELGCQLLVHLFPELFDTKQCCSDCPASRRSLEPLHLQLIRDYVQLCYPSVKSNGVWQDECLLQISDFFHRFWAQRDAESARLAKTQPGAAVKTERPQAYRFINEQGQEEQFLSV